MKFHAVSVSLGTARYCPNKTCLRFLRHVYVFASTALSHESALVAFIHASSFIWYRKISLPQNFTSAKISLPQFPCAVARKMSSTLVATMSSILLSISQISLPQNLTSAKISLPQFPSAVARKMSSTLVVTMSSILLSISHFVRYRSSSFQHACCENTVFCMEAVETNICMTLCDEHKKVACSNGLSSSRDASGACGCTPVTGCVSAARPQRAPPRDRREDTMHVHGVHVVWLCGLHAHVYSRMR